MFSKTQQLNKRLPSLLVGEWIPTTTAEGKPRTATVFGCPDCSHFTEQLLVVRCFYFLWMQFGIDFATLNIRIGKGKYKTK